MTQHQSKQTAILTFSEMGGNKSKEETSPKKCCFNTAGHYNWHYFTHMFLRPWKQVQQWNQFSDLSQLQQSKIRTSPWRCWLWGISTQCGRQVEDEVTGLLSNGTKTNREFIKQEQINEVCSLARHQECFFFYKTSMWQNWWRRRTEATSHYSQMTKLENRAGICLPKEPYDLFKNDSCLLWKCENVKHL